MADWQLHYMTNVMIVTLQSSIFFFYVVIYHFHLLMVCISPSWFDTQEPVLRMRTFQNAANNWQKSWCCRVLMNLVSSHHFARSTVTIMTLFAFTNYHWLICWMICFILFVRLLFPYWLWQWVTNPVYQISSKAHGRCDRSAENSYSPAAPDPTLTFVEGLCCLKLDFVFTLWVTITVSHIVNFAAMYITVCLSMIYTDETK
jgi:hypothetical protein